MNAFQIVFVPFCLAIAALVLARMARGQITRRQGLLWTLLWLAAAGLILDPLAATAVAQRLGIQRGADLVFYLAILSGMVALVYFQNRYRRLEILLTELVRRDAIDHAEQSPGHAIRDRSHG